MKSFRTPAVCGAALAVAAFVSFCTFSQAQGAPSTAASAPGDAASAVRDLQDQVRLLRTMVDEMRAENSQSRTEMEQLRQDLKATRALLERPGAPSGAVTADSTPPENGARAAAPETASGSTSQGATPLEERVQRLEDSTSLLGSKIDEHYQTKVETASKYRARLHGIVLMNVFRNVGESNNLDLPDYAQPAPLGTPQSSFGATLRQSEIGLEIFGPTVGGAKTSANIQLDFTGGFPSVGDGVNFGIARVQTASLRFDWGRTSVIAGQDSLFLSPLSPTSFATLGTPAFAAAGNLWGWTPQIRVEHRFEFSDEQAITLQAGIFDSLNWMPPTDQYYRTAQAGEHSGQPAYGARASWSRQVFGRRPLSIGVAGYSGRQDWTWERYVDSWAGMTDWQIPIAPRLTLSGEFYRGRGIGTFGAAIERPVLFGGPPLSGTTPIRGLDSAGGWSQLALQITPKLDLNGAFSQDNAFASDVRGFATDQNNYGTILGRNRGMLGNVVYRPRSDLLFSAEFRRLRSYPVYSGSSMTNQVNLAMGILF